MRWKTLLSHCAEKFAAKVTILSHSVEKSVKWFIIFITVPKILRGDFQFCLTVSIFCEMNYNFSHSPENFERWITILAHSVEKFKRWIKISHFCAESVVRWPALLFHSVENFVRWSTFLSQVPKISRGELQICLAVSNNLWTELQFCLTVSKKLWNE